MVRRILQVLLAQRSRLKVRVEGLISNAEFGYGVSGYLLLL